MPILTSDVEYGRRYAVESLARVCTKVVPCVRSCMVRNRFFFFSSRRRHTRSDRDWSSDVCSSDLVTFAVTPGGTGYWLGALDGGLFGYGSVTRAVSASSAVDGSGQYRIGVPAGQYVVVVAATVDGRSLRAQTSVTVSDGGTYDVSARLNSTRTGFDFGPFTTISGSVTDATTHAALGGICVSLYSTAGVRTGDPQACTNAQGTYTMAVASAGSYDVAFAGGAGYVTQWYRGQPTQATANAVVVPTGTDTPSVNAAMVP